MIENLVFGAVLFGIAGLWWYSGIAGRLNVEDAALLARVAATPADRPRRCPQCTGRHCADWTRDGAPCPPQRAPRLTDTLLGPGVHEPTAAYRRIVPAGWLPPRYTWSTLRERVGTWPVGVLP